MKLLSTQNSKTTKGEKYGYLSAILYLAPSNTVSGINVCKSASSGCKASCLFTAGRGKFSNVKNARIRKTELLRDNPKTFKATLIQDIAKFKRKAERKGLTPVVRLNGTSDIDFLDIIEQFPETQFYDYSKNAKMFDKKLPSNYHLTFSRSESKKHQKEAIKLLERGHNVAMVFQDIPKTYKGYQVINGDDTDLRFKDVYKKGVVIGLKAKGDAKKDKTGFVIRS